MAAIPPTPAPLPLVVQVAFAGKRVLVDPRTNRGIRPAEFEQAVGLWLTRRLRQLPEELGLGPRHHICGISSLAIGGDSLFTRACEALGWRQRIFLPQAREDFLAAGSPTDPDFTPAQAAEVRRLLDSPHLIEERVCSTAAERNARFEDVNLELVRACDVVVCLLLADPTPGKPGGTADMLGLAQRWHRPALEIRVGMDSSGQPVFTETWHWNRPPAGNGSGSGFQPPTLPAPLDRIECEEGACGDPVRYRNSLKTFAGQRANRHQYSFILAALVIVTAHVLATGLALGAIKGAGDLFLLRWLLALELAFLALGLIYHRLLHRSNAVRHWAMSRLVAEVARSVIPLAGIRRGLTHLFELPMPGELRGLLRTLNYMHLLGTRSLLPSEWRSRRDAYLRDRLTDPVRGQVVYYQQRHRRAKRLLGLARAVFSAGSVGALGATAVKLALVIQSGAQPTALAILGFMAVMLPVVAVAGLSLAAALDLEAREHTFAETLAFLGQQIPRLEAAATENEFATLALETESRMLGETANWYARRAFTGVA